jgi:dipeptidyl aminopeptidase/acylaminoacyl peptidase
MIKKHLFINLLLPLVFAVACTPTRGDRIEAPRPGDVSPSDFTPDTMLLSDPSPTPQDSPETPSPTSTQTPTSTATEIVFEIGKELTIDYLRKLEISGSEITFHERLAPGYNYQRHLVSYLSEGNKIYGLLTVPFAEPPEDGFKAIVFNHGYIPPTTYQTLERYGAYVDYLARSGFVVFKIDFRGHGNSEGNPSGSYFSSGYTVDAIAALKSLQNLDYVDPDGIGMWGHSMAGNLVLRAMLVEPEVKAGVIWAGAVYSYEDFLTYGINDRSYRPPATPEDMVENEHLRSSRVIFDYYGWPEANQPYWQAVSLTENIGYLNEPIQLHHAENDPVVNINYSYGLAGVLLENRKGYEFYTYEGGGHNLISPYFDQAMLRTVEFFEDNL